MNTSSYDEVLKYLYERLPMFSRIGAAAYKVDLGNTMTLSEVIGYPEKSLRCIHIAGTNGKGSVSHMLASILQEAGFKVGLYTSPHIKDFRERIRIDGEMITKNAVMHWTNQLMPIAEKVEASFFEMTFVMSLAYFKEQQVDIAIIETGMGGRLDSTNIVTPLLSIITHIALDHQQFLGDTLQAIAGEKAGIIKNNVPVLIGRRQNETLEVFFSKSQSQNAALFYSDELSEILEFNNASFPAKVKAHFGNSIISFKTPLTANYQKENTAIVLSAVMLLKQYPFLGDKISNTSIKQGIVNVKRNTGFKGRWEVLSKNPLVIADVAHNEEGIVEIIKQIEHTPHEKLHVIYGTVADKDVSKILALLPKEAMYYWTEPAIPRKMPVEILAQKATFSGIQGDSFSSALAALAVAKKNAGNHDLIIITGSFFVVCDVL